MKIKYKKTLLALVMVICLLSQNVVFAASTISDKDLDYMRSVMEMIKEKYNGNVTDQQLMEGALKGMFSTMDPYTEYWNPKEAQSFNNSLDGKFGGAGVVIEKIGDYITVTRVLEGSAAEQAGITAGDKIVEVDGKSIIGLSITEARSYIVGEVGTKVTLGIIKKDQTETTKVEITRALVTEKFVSYNIIKDVAYIRISSFGTNTAKEFYEALSDIDSKNISKIVLDLRNNPGGYLNEAVGIAKQLVPAGLITKLDYKSSEYQDENYYSTLEKTKYKLAVLVNENSASASEILAGAIQDRKAGTLIGTKTFGKAKVQMVVPLLNQEAYAKYEKQVGAKIIDAYQLIEKYGIAPLKSEVIGQAKITVGQYTTPNGRMIDGKGMMPDIVIENDKESKGINLINVSKLSLNTGSAYPTEGQDVYNAEMILRLAGYEVGYPDTVLDDASIRAIAKFQQDAGLIPGGTLDYSTQKALNNKLDNLIREKDKQLSAAFELFNN